MEDKLLPVEQVVYVPSTNIQQKQISPQEMLRRIVEVKRFLSLKYGGFTSVKGEGGYVMHNGKDKMVQEGVVKVTSFATRQKYRQYKPKLISQIRVWGKKWGQESMGLETEGDLKYVYSNPKTPITLKQMTAKSSPSWIEKETKVWK